MEHLNS